MTDVTTDEAQEPAALRHRPHACRLIGRASEDRLPGARAFWAADG